MALAVAVVDHWDDGKRLHVVGTLTASSTYSTNGDTLNFGLSAIKSASPPVWVDFNNLSKYLLKFVFGTNIANGKMKVALPDTGLELAAGNYPAGLTGDSITFHAIFRKFK